MADPLSIAGSIAGLITITEAVFSRAFRYGKAVKNAPAEIADLTTTIGVLTGILHRLHLLVRQLDGEPFDTTIRIHHIYSCFQTVEKVEKMLDKFDKISIGHGREAIRRLKWPFTASEARSLTTEIEQHKSTLSIALAADGLSSLLQALSRQEKMQIGLDQIKAEFKQRREAETRVALDEKQQKIISWIQKCDPHQNHKMALQLRHPGTGLWVIESPEFKSWIESSKSKLWCYGIPGAGKTILASSIIQEAVQQSSSNTAVAFFYCDYKNAVTQDPRNILGSLVKQFAMQDEASFEKLQTFHESKNPKDSPSIDYNLDELRDLVVATASSFNEAIIIVDALDECGTGKQIRYVTELLTSLHDVGDTENIKTLFLSRDELDIRELTEGYSKLSIAATSSDLKLYVGSEIEQRTQKRELRIKDQSLKEQILERLVKDADGMFRWVSCQLDLLSELPNDAARRRALTSLPPTLNATYERILRRVLESNQDVQQMVQSSLRFLTCSRQPLTFSALREAISVNPGDTTLDRTAICDEDEILRSCSSLVRKSVSGEYLELAHFTVQEYLTGANGSRDQKYSAYYFNSDTEDADIAELCLTYLSFDDFINGYDSEEAGPNQRFERFEFFEYATLFWAEHARRHLSRSEIYTPAQKLLHPSKSPVFISWAEKLLERDVLCPQLAAASPLHFAAALALPEICAWLLTAGCSVNQYSAFGTPLHCALVGACREHEDDIPDLVPPVELREYRMSTIRLLINEGADIQRLSLGRSPLHVTYRMDDVESCVELLHHGASLEGIIDDIDRYTEGEWDIAIDVLEMVDKDKLRPSDHAILLKFATQSETPLPQAVLEAFSQESPVDRVAAVAYLDSLVNAATYGQIGVARRLLTDHGLDVNKSGGLLSCPPIHGAIRNDHLEIAEFLIQHGVDCSLTDHDGRTPLHYAVEGPNRCLALILDQCVDVDVGDSCGLTAWHLAASSQNLTALKLLEGRVADQQSRGRLKANDGETPLHCAVQSESMEILEYLTVRWGKEAVRDTSLDGSTALHYAVRTKSVDIVRYLIAQSADPHAVSNDGSTTLHHALERDRKLVLGIVELLLDLGLDPARVREDGQTSIHVLLANFERRGWKYDDKEEFRNLLTKLAQHTSCLDAGDYNGLTALHYVCQLKGVSRLEEGRHIALEILLKSGADPSVRDKKGSTALEQMIEIGEGNVLAILKWKEESYMKYNNVSLNSDLKICSAMITTFLDSVVDPDSIRRTCADPRLLCLSLVAKEELLTQRVLKYSPSVDEPSYKLFRVNALQVACEHGCSPQLLEELLGRSKFDREIAVTRFKLLHYACAGDQATYEIVVYLLEHGISPKGRNLKGQSALMLAASNGNIAIVKCLITHGADISATDIYGWSIIHYACDAGHLELLSFFHSLNLDWHIAITADIIPGGSWNVTILHLAAGLDNDTLGFLFENDLVTDANLAAQTGETALYIAALEGLSHNVKLLLSRSAKVELLYDRSESPLQAASRNGHLAVVEILVDHGSNLQLRDRSGFTAELLARKHGHVGTADFLRKRSLGRATVDNQAEGIGNLNSSPLFSGPLRLAIDQGDLQLCQNLVKGGCKLRDKLLCDDGTHITPVLYALRMGQVEIANHLISQGSSIADNPKGDSPFHFAAFIGLVETLRILFEKYPLGMLCHCGPAHPINHAIARGNVDCVKLIIDNARLVDTTAQSTVRGSKVSVEHLCGGNYDLCHLMGLETGTSLHTAAMYGQVDIAKSLIDLGASVHATDSNGSTPLHVAASHGQTKMIETLLKTGANANVGNVCLQTPCMLAAQRGFVHSIHTLMNGGADLTMKDMLKQTVLHHAAFNRAWSTAIFLINNTEPCMLSWEEAGGISVFEILVNLPHPFLSRFLLNLAPEPSVYESRSGNVLSSMADNYNPSCFRMLLRRLPKILVHKLLSQPASRLGTPLYRAATRPAEKVIDMLLDAGADIELEGGEYGTPLMGACATGRITIVKKLIAKGARTSYTKQGRIISVITAARLHPEVRRWLLVGRFAEGPKSIAGRAA